MLMHVGPAGKAKIAASCFCLEPSDADLETCPIGHAAYVDFPDIGILDILRARLRL